MIWFNKFEHNHCNLDSSDVSYNSALATSSYQNKRISLFSDQNYPRLLLAVNRKGTVMQII